MIKNSCQFELHSDMLERKRERKGERREEKEERRKEGKSACLMGFYIFSFYTHKFSSVG